jgi:hypothetical protein
VSFSGLTISESTMTETSPINASGSSASLVLGRKLDSIPFSAYHVLLIVVLGTVGFVEGYDLALGGSLLVNRPCPVASQSSRSGWHAASSSVTSAATG